MPIPETLTVDETDISLVTGKIRNTGISDKEVEAGTSMVLRSDAFSVAIQADTAGWHTVDLYAVFKLMIPLNNR